MESPDCQRFTARLPQTDGMFSAGLRRDTMSAVVHPHKTAGGLNLVPSHTVGLNEVLCRVWQAGEPNCHGDRLISLAKQLNAFLFRTACHKRDKHTILWSVRVGPPLYPGKVVKHKQGQRPSFVKSTELIHGESQQGGNKSQKHAARAQRLSCDCQ